MHDFIIYALQTISIQLVFFVVYQMLLKQETFFKCNRVYLLGALVVSFVLPILKFSYVTNATTQFVALNEIILSNKLDSGLNVISNTFVFQYYWLQVVYFVGVVVSLFFLVFKLAKILKLINTSKKETYNGVSVYKLANSNQAFSFLNCIFIGDANKDFELILKHELIHKKQAHSVDLLLVEFAKVVFWFNPLLYIYQNKLAEMHEFEADATSVSFNKHKYYEAIINQVFQVENIAFTNNFFNQSLIKKRIVMLQKSKSKKISMLKYATAIPLLLVSFMLFSTKTIAQEKTTKVNGVEEMPFNVIDQIPVFTGCENVAKEASIKCFNEMIRQHIVEHFTYPKDAAKNNIEGRVSVQFTINKDGNVVDIKTRGPKGGQLLEDEGRRIVSLLPKFQPGIHKGKAVSVKYGLPITFKLISDKENASGDLLPPPPPKNVPAPPKPTFHE